MTRHSHALPALLETATRGLMYPLVFLLPLWFVPLTFDVLEVNKQVLFLVLTFTAALTWSGSMLFAKSATTRLDISAMIVAEPLRSVPFSPRRRIPG
jgi:hypothetical protein